jgi:Kef-type K+ transport system membrane component KefB
MMPDVGALSLAALSTEQTRSMVLVLAASASALFIARTSSRAVLPTVVVEIALGILLGPHVLGWATAGPYVQFLANIGLGFLFFFAGVEIVEQHVARASIVRGSIGWAISLAIAIGAGYLLHSLGLHAEGWLVGVAVSTTALGTLVPMLSDAGILPTHLGSAVLGSGVAGEFWPIVVISVFLTGVYGAGVEIVLLLAFAALSFGAAMAALRARPPHVVSVLRDTLHTTGQAAVRLSILLLAGLVLIASRAGFDFVLGAFAAGLIVGLLLDSPEGHIVRMRLEGIGFGFLIPIYFVTTGLTFDLSSLLTLNGIGLATLFLGLFLLTRGASAMLWLRELGGRRTSSLAFFSATALPLVVAIVTVGTDRGAVSASVGASLIGAGMISVLVYPLIASALIPQSDGGDEEAAHAPKRRATTTPP